MKKSNSWFWIMATSILALIFVSVLVWPAQGQTIANNFVPDQNPLFEKLREKGFAEREIQRIFTDRRIKLHPEILIGMKKRIDYFGPKFGLFTKQSIDNGKKILAERGYILEKIENNFGVEKEAVISFFRMETNFGQYLARYLVFNSLYTLWQQSQMRSEWAAKELVCFLVICRHNKIDPFQIGGSPMGAFGLWQFIPSSYLNYAIDGNGDGKIDLFDFEDGAFSAANYLKIHGWRPGVGLEDNKHAIFAYNRNWDYVQAVIVYGQVLKIR